MNDTILEIKDLHVLFPVHKKWLPAVDGVNLKIEKGEITGVVGESGSGKSVMSQTILRLRDHDTNVRYEGEILFEGEDLLKQPLNKIRDIRGDRISVIFQDPLTSLSPVHTVGSQLSEVLTLHKGLNKEQAKEKAMELLNRVGVGDKADNYPAQLSGGQKQRTAIARALVTRPAIILADEPTGNLDSQTELEVMSLLKSCVSDFGQTLIMITHDETIAQMADEMIIIEDGKAVRR